MIVIFILIILFGIFVKQRPKWLELIIITFECVILYLQSGSPDFTSYENVYNYIGSGASYIDTGYGWMLICKVGNVLHLSYKQFQIVLFLFCILLIRNFVISSVGKTKNMPTVFALYLLYPALLDLVQFRCFVATALVIWGFNFLEKKRSKNYFLFMLILIISSTIHSSVLFYSLFLLAPLFEKIKKVLFGIIAISSVSLLLFKDKFILLLSLFINENRITRYLLSDETLGIYGVIAYITTLIAFNIILLASYKIIKEKSTNNFYISFINNVYIYSIFVWLALPLATLDTNMFRVQRIMWILLYMVLAMLLNEHIYTLRIFKNISVKVRLIGFILAFLGFAFYICYFTFNVIEAYLL